jgi:adenosylmethionine-8-amino-7-oxononanoate aminotransferase
MANNTIWRPYTQMKTAPPALQVVRTEGTRIYLADGRVLVDGIASWWTACHGYNHPHIRAAVEEQLRAMPHIMFGGLTHAPAERLAARLIALAPGSLEHVFFADSGSVAVEVAMKIAVQYWLNRGVSGRTRFVAFRDGYHGDTLGAMSVCDPDAGMHAGLRAYLPGQIVADLPRTPQQIAALDSLLAAHAHEIAAVIVEPLVQGAGGMRFHEPAVLARVADLVRGHGLLLIADEIFTGFGRTGTM